MWSSSLFAVSSIQWHDPHLADPMVAAGTSNWPLTTCNGVCERGIADWGFNSLDSVIMEAANFWIQRAWKMTATGGLMDYICSHSERVAVKVCTHKHICSRVFLPLDLFLKYWIEHVTIGLLYIKFIFSIKIFYKGVSGYATDCPCSVWCRGSTTCFLYVGSFFLNFFL